MELDLVQLKPAEARDRATELRALYLDAYSEPPYNYDEGDADEFVKRLTDQSERRDFTLIAGTVGDDTVAFTYGFHFPTEIWWRGAQDPPPAGVATGSKFAVIEMGVQPSHRGRGYAKILMQSLLRDRKEDYGILLSMPGSRAHDMYERWGWVTVGKVQPYPHWPVNDAMVLSLR